MMNVTDRVPNVPISDFKRTKIIATLGPSTNSYELVLELIRAGANGIRLNFSHGNYEERLQQIEWIRKASHEYAKPVAIIQDLQGPKIRLGDFNGIVNVTSGQTLKFKYHANHVESGEIPVQYDLSKKVKRGERMLLFDGKVRTVITSVQNGIVYAKAENEGILISRKGINLPDTDFGGDIITLKDRKDLAFGAENDIDYVALSFVQTAQDISKLRNMLKSLGSHAKIIAKIETKAALDNIEDIVKESDMVMVARGDLAVETLPESVPVVQRKIIGLCANYAKPTIVATQMLASMTEASEPTRAEVSDIATAVILGVDAVMLSDETAAGQYPIQAVNTMKRVVRYTELNNPLQVTFNVVEELSGHLQYAISEAILKLAESVGAKAIVAETMSGYTALQIAARRPKIPVIAVTSDYRTARRLALVYGTKSFVRPADQKAAIKLTNWLYRTKALLKGDVVVTVSGQHPGVVGTTDTIKVRVI